MPMATPCGKPKHDDDRTIAERHFESEPYQQKIQRRADDGLDEVLYFLL